MVKYAFVALAITLTACAEATFSLPSSKRSDAAENAPSLRPPPAVPSALQASPNETLVLRARGTGTQNYECRNGAWALTGPQADLVDDRGQVIGRHFAGPTWALADGSQVAATLAAKVDAPNDGAVPWLLLHTSSHADGGQLARVTSIQRLDTHGGSAPTAPCTESQRLEVPYSAMYYFYAAAH